jgi:subtilisin family serine protease
MERMEHRSRAAHGGVPRSRNSGPNRVQWRRVAWFAALALCAGVAAHGEVGAPAFAADELLVGVGADGANGRAEMAYRAAGAEKIGAIEAIGVHHVRVPAQARDAIAAALAARSEFRFVELNPIFAPEALALDDPAYSLQWHLHHIELPQAWEISAGAPDVVIAVLDTGVNPVPDLADRLLVGFDAHAGGSDAADRHGHGTEVAGAAAAIGNNALGVASPAWDASILPVRVTDASGFASGASIGQGLTGAVDRGARVLNVSFDGISGSATVRAAARYVAERGGVIVASAGNCGCYESLPETPDILSVAGTDVEDRLAEFSSRGAHVDLCAPAVDILTTDADGSYTSASGTSFSSPLVAGVVALMLSVNPDLGALDVAALLADSALDLGVGGWDEAFGYGRVDAFAAVEAAAASAPGSAIIVTPSPGETPAPTPGDTTVPIVAIESPADGGVFSKPVKIRVAAQDDALVESIELRVDGRSLGTATCGAASCAAVFRWHARKEGVGAHEFTAYAVDASGNVGRSASVVLHTATDNRFGTARNPS